MMENERPTPLIEDSEATRKKLESWFSSRRGHTVHIPDFKIPEASGMSNVTLLFDIEWREGDELHREPCVGRLQPEIARPVFPSYDLTLQYEVMDSIGRNSDIPVPELLGLETDLSVLGIQFYIMKRVDGRIPTDMPPYNMDGWMLHETTDAQRETIWRSAVDTLGRYHKLDYIKLGFEHLAEPGKTPLQQQLDYWWSYLDWAMEGKPHATCRRALDWLQANQPVDEPTVLCWGDARIGNIIFDASRYEVATVLDWEMAVLGNPVQDIAWFNYMDATFAEGLGMPRLSGLPSYPDTIEQWQAVSGYSAKDYDYYLIFAAMRYGIILSRIMLATGQDGEVQENFACALLKKHLDGNG
jgi:aminoglycoside phosphotransferase (APT) family kinase protein